MNLIQQLFNIGVIEFGSFKLKSGIVSPYYVDLRKLVSYPKILQQISDKLAEKIKDLKYDIICGLPYAGMQYATLISVRLNKPKILLRKERKKYGTKKIIEGKYNNGDKCVIIDDVLTTGSSIKEGTKILNDHNIQVIKSIVIIDRSNDKNITSLYTIKDICTELYNNKNIDIKTFNKVIMFNSSLKQKIRYIMEKKETNLCVAADVNTTEKLIDLINKVGPHICILKVHIDIINDFNTNFINNLIKLKYKYNFLIMEDRKFSDIGNTVFNQYHNGVYKISSWADLITVHSISGPKILECFDNNIVLIESMSTKDNLINDTYSKKTMNMINNCNSVIGIVTQNGYNHKGDLLNFIPGVKLIEEIDNDQQYNTPYNVFTKKNADIMIVGRGIYNSQNIEKEAIKYKEIGWKLK